MKLFAVVCVFLVTMGSAHAQPAAQPAAVPARPAAPEPGEVSPAAALMLSLGGTLVSYGTIAAGFQTRSGAVVVAGALGAVVMPSAGRWYANSAGIGSLALRAAGAGSFLAGLVVGFGCIAFDEPNTSSCNGQEVTSLIVLGGLAFVGSTVYDIVRAPLDARAYNAARRAPQITLVPLIAPAQHDYGIALAGRF